MAKYLVLQPITIMHQNGTSEDYSRGMIADLEAYTAAILLEKKCIQPFVMNGSRARKLRTGIIKLEELKHDTDNR